MFLRKGNIQYFVKGLIPLSNRSCKHFYCLLTINAFYYSFWFYVILLPITDNCILNFLFVIIG